MENENAMHAIWELHRSTLEEDAQSNRSNSKFNRCYF